MKPKEFFQQVRHDEIVGAIRDAEKKTSAEIRVFVSRKTVNDPVKAAAAAFEKLGMTETHERNGVLIFVAPRSQKFAVIGDKGVHEKCGVEFWQWVSNEMSGHFKASRFTEGLVHGVSKAGGLLAQHFPRRADDQNELSDRVAHD